jgi:glutathione S-transferase
MKLHWSPRSPFVRKVMIAAHELGLAERFSTVRTVVHPEVPHEGLMADNPLSKLPTLVLDDGSALFDSRVICEYFDGLAGGARLFPATGSERLAALRDQALGDGLMDIALLWLMERYEPEERRSPRLIAAFQTKVARTLDRLDADIGAIAARPYDIGHLTIGTSLSYLDFRFPDLAWRNGHDRQAVWHAGFAARPAVQANPVVDDA